MTTSRYTKKIKKLRDLKINDKTVEFDKTSSKFELP